MIEVVQSIGMRPWMRMLGGSLLAVGLMMVSSASRVGAEDKVTDEAAGHEAIRASLQSLVQAADPIRIIDHSQALAVVIIAPDASEQVRQAADSLIDYLDRSTAVRLEVKQEAEAIDEDVVRLHVGRTDLAQSVFASLEGLDGDAFAIVPMDIHNVVLVGVTDWGTEFAVNDFLERYVGVRWLMPGPYGEDVPALEAVDVTPKVVLQAPGFISRDFSGIGGTAEHGSDWAVSEHMTWARRNRLHSVARFHHNLFRLIPPIKYRESHPEFFPIHKGKRYLPPATEDESKLQGWQPCFSAEGLVEEAIQNIREYFDANPEERWYSLGVNDSGGSCEGDRCMARYGDRPVYSNAHDASDIYFEWCNRVVAGVLETHPDKYFGLLAYRQVMYPPRNVRLNSHIVPFITEDRMNWADPERRAKGQALIESWAEKADSIGLYDYVYGTPYLVPRIYHHLFADVLRYARQKGIKAMYAEAYPNFGEGPKLYTMLRLEWDPMQDVDTILDDWYVHAVGPDAAEDLAQYETLWEKFWTEDIPQSDWFKRSQSEYLWFHQPDYLEPASDELILQSRSLLESMLSKTNTQAQRHRAKVLLDAFEYYEASVLAYNATKIAAEPVSDVDQAKRALADGAIRTAYDEKRFRLVNETFLQDTQLFHPVRFDHRYYPDLRERSWGPSLLWKAYGWAIQTDQRKPILAAIEQVAAESDSPLVQDHLQAMRALLERDRLFVSLEDSFESTPDQTWSHWSRNDKGLAVINDESAMSGQQSTVFRGVDSARVLRQIDVKPGRYIGVAFFRTPPSTTSRITGKLILRLKDKKGETLQDISGELILRTGDWMPLAFTYDVPATINDAPIAGVELLIGVDELADDESVYVDNVSLVRLE